MKKFILLFGAGKIGRMIAWMLHDSGDYQLRVVDRSAEALECIQQRVPGVETCLLTSDEDAELIDQMQGMDAVISAISYFGNPKVARAAQASGISYFDLTEDRETTSIIKEISEQAKTGQVFFPQCGLAPGFVSIVAVHLMEWLDEIDSVNLRVGALPRYPTNALTYNLTWSTDGLINEYCNPCDAIHKGEFIQQMPLEGLEKFSLEGNVYEAFNTSGGLGTLCDTLEGKVENLNYRTVRYPGHRDIMKLLIQDLSLGKRVTLLKDILESSIPITMQDVVLVFVNVSGQKDGQFMQTAWARKIYAREIGGRMHSAIQITTASGICAALDLMATGHLPTKGLVKQEDIPFEAFIENRFGCNYVRDTTVPSLGGRSVPTT